MVRPHVVVSRLLHDLEATSSTSGGPSRFRRAAPRCKADGGSFRSLAAFFVAHVARGAPRAADIVLFLVLRHLDLHQGGFRREHELGETFASRVCPTVGPAKMKLPMAFGPSTGPALAHALAIAVIASLLADHGFVQSLPC